MHCREMPYMMHMHWSQAACLHHPDHVSLALSFAAITEPCQTASFCRSAKGPGLTHKALVQAAGARAGWAHAVKSEDTKYGSMHGMHSEVRGY